MIYREQVLRFLQEKQETEGGYTGSDLTRFAEVLQVTSRGLKKRIAFWIRTDKDFSKFIYLGKEKPPITLFEFFKIEQGLESNPIQVKKGMYDDIQEERIAKNQEPLAKTTFYRGVNQTILSMFGSDQDNWFKAKKIPFPENYSLEKNRESLQTIFTFSNLKIYGGADIEGIYKRLVKAKEVFSIYNVNAIRYYPEILSKRKFLKKLLNSIPPNQQLEAQAKLIFQIQASYIIECNDLLIVELIHKYGRTIQSDNASRQKTENKLRKDALNAFRNEFKNKDDSDKIDAKDIKKHANVVIEEEILARMKLLREHTDAYRTILKFLNDLTNNMTTGVKFHRNEAKTVYKLATGELTWDKLNEQGKKSITWKPDLTKAIDHGNADVVPLIAINRLIEYIRKGKITFDESYYFQDIGERLRNVELNLNDSYLTSEILDKLIACTYPINGFPQFDIPYLFSWDEIPGNDSERLIDFLKQKFSIDWVKTAKIEKIDNGKTIKASAENNFLLLKLNNEITKLNLEIDDGRTDEFIVKTENDKLNIYYIPTTDIEPSDDELPTKLIDLSDILIEVSKYIRNSNPSWFKEHCESFKKQMDGLFWIEYTEDEFAKRLYDCIGFLGRNFRYRDFEEFPLLINYKLPQPTTIGFIV